MSQPKNFVAENEIAVTPRQLFAAQANNPMDHRKAAEEVFDVVFTPSDESAEVVHPREEPLHFPASAVAAQLTGSSDPRSSNLSCWYSK